jgi:predicted ATPase
MARLAPGPRLRGREVELRALDDVLDRVASGRSAIVLVEGEAGIGKTRLLAETLERARARGVQVAAGRAEELERTRPFGLVADTLGCVRSSSDPRRAAIAGLLATSVGDRGPMTVSSDPGLQFQAVDAFVDLVEALALRGPLVVGVDDLQWADPSSLLTLGTLGRRLIDVPLALIGCLRPSPHPEELQRTLRALEQAGAQRLALGRLDQQAVVGLVAEAVAAEPGPGLLAEVAGAGGNPLFVTELVAARVQEGAIRTVDGRAEVTELSLPPSLRLTILRRLSLLPENTLEALQAASIPGSSFALTDLSSVAGRSLRTCQRCWRRRSGRGWWRMTATVSGSATTSSARRSTRTFPPACAWGCTARRAGGWRRREPQPCGWPSTWPAGPGRGTPRPPPG